MAVKIKNDPTPEKNDDASNEIALELAAFQRYHVNGRLFERNTVYVFPEAEAKKYLRIRDDSGRPVFSRYEEELETQQEAKVVRVPVKVQRVDESTVVRTDSENESKPTRVDVGDDDELEKDGILPKNDDKGEEAPL